MFSKSLLLLMFALSISAAFIVWPSQQEEIKIGPRDCVFNTVFGVVPLDTSLIAASSDNFEESLSQGLAWLMKAQHEDGGWGAGSHAAQHIRDPHGVPSDPATTAMVSMALLRAGSDLNHGSHQEQLAKATEFILQAIEQTPPDGSKITDLNGTQIQQKLGQNIDLVLSLQYLNNLLEKTDTTDERYKRIENVIYKSVDIVQTNMDASGRTKGAGWAGVLQSAFATSALESSQANGIWINEEKLRQARGYQNQNYDAASGKVKTMDGAGVMLYSVSGSVRGSAQGARRAREMIQKAQDDGVLEKGDSVNYDNLRKAGLGESEALEYDAAYNVYQSAKIKAQDKQVMSGFGNNGGEEFLSYLQTGESLILNKDDSWKNWYDQMSANLLNIQNQDGSWNGHHCITSPVFCTATCVLILTIQNDIDALVARGE